MDEGLQHSKEAREEVHNGVRQYSNIALVPSRMSPGEFDLRFESGPGMASVVGVTDADLRELRSVLARYDLQR